MSGFILWVDNATLLL